ELAARIAHEIRNPITAARSLAQQLVQEESAFGEEHRLILAELERVEKQVAALLRFARREEFRFEGVDLGELARATVAGFRTRLEAAGVDVELELADGVTARADREKMRQVLINLIESAYHIVITDLSLKQASGMDVLRWTRQHAPETAVIMITAFGSEKIAVEAMKVGAADYLPKPFDNDELQLTVERVLEGIALRRDLRRLQEQ